MIDYQSLQEDPIETVFRRLITQEVPEWDEGAALAGEAATRLKDMKWPLRDGRLAGLFNLRAAKGRRKHTGVDMLAPKGTPIYAALDGVVEVIANGQRGWRGYGRVIFINHGDELWSLYSHCDTILVKMGQKVKQGDKIATVGRTGRATGNHLHFEIRNKSGMHIDPMKFLPSEGRLPSAYK
jgi:murein DD-endopeptidase MepM/ murein hydrolase activator NlpD